MIKPIVCIKVPKSQGEKTILLTIKLGLIDKSLSIHHSETSICIPLIRQPKENEIEVLRHQVPQSHLTTNIFIEKKPSIPTLIQNLKEQIPQNLLASLPHALDIIGDIAIIEVTPELKPYEKTIGTAILKTNKNFKTVLAKAGAINGTYRTREYNFIAGENRTYTIHREYGCQYYVDIAKTYFSPRLSHEHQRVASLVQSGETVVDLFAGVGPFSVLIAKTNPEVKVYSIDINPVSIEMLRKNVRINKVENRVLPILADARDITAKKLSGVADRVIMNLPETAIAFVDAACQAVKPLGGIIHFYGFVRSPNTIANLQHSFSQAIEKANRKVQSIIYAKKIRETAPYEWQVVLDTQVS
jgi:tRNA (guanine37-N1)-methyltransferase